MKLSSSRRVYIETKNRCLKRFFVSFVFFDYENTCLRIFIAQVNVFVSNSSDLFSFFFCKNAFLPDCWKICHFGIADCFTPFLKTTLHVTVIVDVQIHTRRWNKKALFLIDFTLNLPWATMKKHALRFVLFK